MTSKDSNGSEFTDTHPSGAPNQDEHQASFKLLTKEHQERLVRRGRGSRSVNPKDLLEVLQVEKLSSELQGEVDDFLAAEDIVVDASQAAEAELLAQQPTRRQMKRRRNHSKILSKAKSAGADPVSAYLKEIGGVPLLDATEEVEIATAVQQGMDASAVIADHLAAGEWVELDIAEKRRLRRAVSAGEEATEILTSANLRLVVSIAKRYTGRGMPMLDLIQEGNLGLMRAVQKFDPEKGFKFSTYATWWIRQAVSRALADQSRTIRVPIHMVETMNRVLRAKRALAQDLEREPTMAELADHTDLAESKVSEILQISRQDPMSLDTPVGAEEDSTLSDFVPDLAPAPLELAAKGLLSSSLNEILDGLDTREASVLRMRFGLLDGRPRTLEEVGQAFGVTRERIRQIESRTLAKLRHPLRSDGLRDYLN